MVEWLHLFHCFRFFFSFFFCFEIHWLLISFFLVVFVSVVVVEMLNTHTEKKTKHLHHTHIKYYYGRWWLWWCCYNQEKDFQGDYIPPSTEKMKKHHHQHHLPIATSDRMIDACNNHLKKQENQRFKWWAFFLSKK